MALSEKVLDWRCKEENIREWRLSEGSWAQRADWLLPDLKTTYSTITYEHLREKVLPETESVWLQMEHVTYRFFSITVAAADDSPVVIKWDGPAKRDTGVCRFWNGGIADWFDGHVGVASWVPVTGLVGGVTFSGNSVIQCTLADCAPKGVRLFSRKEVLRGDLSGALKQAAEATVVLEPPAKLLGVRYDMGIAFFGNESAPLRMRLRTGEIVVHRVLRQVAARD